MITTSTQVRPDLVALMKEGAAEVGASFTKPEDDWVPVMLVRCPKGVGAMVVPIVPDRRATFTAVKEFLRDCEAEEVVMVASSWFVVRNEELGEDDLPVSEQPDRQEVLMLTHVTRDSAELSMALIHRDGTNPPTLGEWEEQEGGPFLSGGFADALRAGIG